jgi:cytochrome c oxidase cbb3-type subunit 3
MIRFALITMALIASCKREQRSFEASAVAKNPASLAPQGGLAAGGAPLVAGAELELALPDYAETAQKISEGKMLYQRMNCVGCHHYGGGGMGPAFMRPDWTYGKEPLDIATSIIAGRKNGMPSYRGKLTGTELGEIVAYVRVLGDLVRTDAVPARDEHLRLGPDPVLEDLAIPHGSKP